MSSFDLTLLSALGGLIAGVVALMLVLWLVPASRGSRRSAVPETLAEPRSFVFRNGYLVEHSGNASFLISEPVDNLKAWTELRDSLAEMVDGIDRAFADLRDSGKTFRIEGAFGQDLIHVMGMRQGEDLRITVASLATKQTSMRVDIASLNSLQADVDLLTESSDSTPTVSWAADTAGRIVWSNAAYQDLATRCIGPDATRGWPIAALFPDQGNAPPPKSRRQITDTAEQTHWYEIWAMPVNERGVRHMHALSLDPVIAAEDNLRTFIQTLTKTFAYLPTGLAIFDRDRRLAMFNPALMDMTGLDGAWMSRRPKLEDFFDALRDHRKLPEPRDYKAWRDGLSDLSRVDERGIYRETWTLPNGQTYCVTGRPQADGAVALMLEDVSADVSASRAHRDERDALLGALEVPEEAVLVFAPDGKRLAANASAVSLLCAEGSGSVPETLEACLSDWRNIFLPSPVWGDLHSFAKAGKGTLEGAEWTETLIAQNGTEVLFRIVPGKGGSMTLIFAPRPSERITEPVPVREVAEPVA
ncbi:MAG: PAS-domain containing protein [Jannaschia sp.]